MKLLSRGEGAARRCERDPVQAVSDIVNCETVLDSKVVERAGIPIGRFNTADPLDLVGGVLALVVVAVVVLLTARAPEKRN